MHASWQRCLVLGFPLSAPFPRVQWLVQGTLAERMLYRVATSQELRIQDWAGLFADCITAQRFLVIPVPTSSIRHRENPLIPDDKSQFYHHSQRQKHQTL